jgi:hypothetical protein
MECFTLAWAQQLLATPVAPILLDYTVDAQGVLYLIGCNAEGCPNRVHKTRPHALYCSDRCRVRASRERARARRIIREAHTEREA